jgi:hypothetical protein
MAARYKNHLGSPEQLKSRLPSPLEAWMQVLPSAFSLRWADPVSNESLKSSNN